jgi:predicted nucleic acid-binding protein
MPGRAFVDTNVLVYAVDDADPSKRDAARDVLARTDADLVISAQVLSEFYVVVTRRLATPMSEREAAAAVDELARIPTLVTDAELIRDGIALAREARVSFWDGLMVAAARASGCERVITEDLATGATIGGVRVESPFAD